MPSICEVDVKHVDAAFIERHKTHGFENPELVALMQEFKNHQIPVKAIYVKCGTTNTYVYGFIKENIYENILSRDTESLKGSIVRIVANNEKLAPDNIYHRCNITFHFRRYLH